MWFFCYAPEVSAEGPLNDCFLNHYECFVGFEHPFYLEAQEDLGYYLAHAVALRVHDRTPTQLIYRLRDEALATGRGQAVVAPMLKYDQSWTLEHLDAIVEHSPRAISAYLAHNRKHGIPFDGVLRRVGHHISPDVLAHLFKTFYGRDPTHNEGSVPL